MNIYLILIRGVNVGGKNKLPMADLRQLLERLGFADVATYIASGNAIVRSDLTCQSIKILIETELTRAFKFDDKIIKVLVLSYKQLENVIRNKPAGFGENPSRYHSDVIFLIDVEVRQVMPIFNPRQGVDKIWPGPGVIYSQRLSIERTKSRLSLIMASPLYKSMTIRNWRTTTELFDRTMQLEQSH